MNTLILGRIIQGGGQVLYGDRLVIAIWSVSRREKPDIEKKGQDIEKKEGSGRLQKGRIPVV